MVHAEGRQAWRQRRQGLETTAEIQNGEGWSFQLRRHAGMYGIQYEEWDMILVQQQYLSDSDYLGDVESAGYCLLCSECRGADGDERWYLDRMGLVCSYCKL